MRPGEGDADDIDQLRDRLDALVARLGSQDAASDLTSEALEELTGVVEEIQAQNARLRARDVALVAKRRKSRDLFETIPDSYPITETNGLVAEDVRVSDERLRALFETAQVGIVLCDSVGDILFSNRHADDLLDRAPDAMSLSTWLRTLDADDLAQIRAKILAACEDGESGSLRHGVAHRNGDMRWIDHDIAPFRGADGSVTGFVSTLSDATAEHRAMLDLRTGRDFVTALFDTLGALVVVIDRHGLILSFNKAAEAVTGLSASDVVGTSLLDSIVTPEHREEVAKVYAQQAQASATATIRYENDWITTPAGDPRIVAWRITTLVDDDGDVSAFIGTGIDVTEQRLLERRVAQSDRLASLGRLTAGIAHDFNNTLTILRLRADRLEARLRDRSSRADIETIVETIDRTRSMIIDLVSFSSRQDFDPKPIDLNAEIVGAAGDLDTLLGADIELELDLVDTDTTTLVDPARFSQILTNLTLNARDAMPGGGTLVIATEIDDADPGPHVDVEPPTEDDIEPGSRQTRFVRISVTDTGTGIEADDLSHIFDPYFTTKPPGRGTGLGLATTYGAVTQSGGTIEADSRPGGGATVTIWLPHVPTPDIDPAPTPQAAVPQGGLVLVVDDDSAIRAGVVDQLQRSGFRTLDAASGGAALGHIHEPIDVLVCDVQLPDANGHDVAVEFVRRHEGLVVIYISGAPAADVRCVIGNDAVVVAKPFFAEDLIRVIRSGA